MSGEATSILHQALEPVDGRPLSDRAATDRERVGLLLQGVALLSHLERGRWRLTDRWSSARVCAQGRLRLPAGAEPGPARRLPQEEARELLQTLFQCDERLAGRGDGRRAARRLLAIWQQGLAPISADQLAHQILEHAPFLWGGGLEPARAALAGAIERLEGPELWVAGPPRLRRRLLRAFQTLPALRLHLESEAAGKLWLQLETDWTPDGPSSGGGEANRLARAEGWFAAGRFERARTEIAGMGGRSAALLRLACRFHLGEIAGVRESLRRLRLEEASPAERLRAAELAVPAFSAAGEMETAGVFARAAVEGASGELLPRALLVMVRAARSAGEIETATAALAAAEQGLGDPDFDWRWRGAAGILALDRGDGPAAATFLKGALAGRRSLHRIDAARLWSDLAAARQLTADLAGSERACLHAVRLYAGCDGGRTLSVALYNLAEIRLRRGRLHGLRAVLERLQADDEKTGDLRRMIENTELWVRYELAQGRAHAGLERCEEALRQLDRRGDPWRRDDFHALAARALGWLCQPQPAAAHLASVSGPALARFEAEERPALYALAGDREGALAAAVGTPFVQFWQGALTGSEIPASAWGALRSLDRYRWARLVCDLELVAPGFVPRYWLRSASAALRRAGAGSLAERLEEGDALAWRAVEGYFGESDGADADRGALAEMFAAAGYRDARLVRESGQSTEIVVAGPGGAEELSAPCAGGRLCLSAPVVDPTLRALFRVALRDLRGAGVAAAPAPADGSGVVGTSPVLHIALHRVSKLAQGDLPVLILGETGTGKELVARQVHRASRRAEGPFLAINCAALSETLLVSDLFGHVRGAFTGADRDRPGVFEAARGGTVFLDEIGDLPPTAQGMLLRVLQEGELRRVGESLPRRVDVRAVAATHRDLATMVRRGTFREDLYYRLKVASVTLPPLRDRGDDVLLLAQHFLSRRRPHDSKRLSPAARARLLGHSWPGNIRELQNVLEVAVALAPGNLLLPEHLDLPTLDDAPRGDYHLLVESFRRRLVAEAVATTGNLADAARKLGLTRQAISYLVRQLEIPQANGAGSRRSA